MNGVRLLSAALFTLHNFSFFSLHCSLFSLRIFSKKWTRPCSKTKKDEQGGRGDQNSGILSERTF